MMNLQELQDKAHALESELEVRFREFYKETGLMPISIDMDVNTQRSPWHRLKIQFNWRNDWRDSNINR